MSIAEPSALEGGSSESVLSSVNIKKKETVSFVASDETTQGYPGSLANRSRSLPLNQSEFLACKWPLI